MNDAPLTPPPRHDPPNRNTVGWGLLTGLLILIANSAFFFIPPALIIAFFPGIVQWLIVGPVAIYWWRSGSKEAAKGLLIFAGMVSLANAACCGLIVQGGF